MGQNYKVNSLFDPTLSNLDALRKEHTIFSHQNANTESRFTEEAPDQPRFLDEGLNVEEYFNNTLRRKG